VDLEFIWLLGFVRSAAEIAALSVGIRGGLEIHRSAGVISGSSLAAQGLGH
jgi:hypothetical protein